MSLHRYLGIKKGDLKYLFFAAYWRLHWRK